MHNLVVRARGGDVVAFSELVRLTQQMVYGLCLRMLIVALYGTVIAVAIIDPGLTTLYYYAPRNRIRAYRTATPDWILALQHAGVVI